MKMEKTGNPDDGGRLKKVKEKLKITKHVIVSCFIDICFRA